MKPISSVFLDRDGTIIEDLDYPREPERVTLIPQAVEGMLLMQQKGYTLFVVSNQSGVGRGIIADHEFQAVHARVCELLQKENVEIAEFGYCLHRPEDECVCRKPRTGLVPRQFQGRSIELSTSFVVGDREGDLRLATNLGAQPFLVLTGVGMKTDEALRSKGECDFYRTCASLLEMAELLPHSNQV